MRLPSIVCATVAVAAGKHLHSQVNIATWFFFFGGKLVFLFLGGINFENLKQPKFGNRYNKESHKKV